MVDLKVSLLTSCFELKGPGPKKDILDTYRHTWPYEVLSPPLILIEANSPFPRHRHPCRLVAGVAKASFACYPPRYVAPRCKHIRKYTCAIWGFPKLGVPFWGVPIIRLIVFWSLYCGPPMFRDYHNIHGRTFVCSFMVQSFADRDFQT